MVWWKVYFQNFNALKCLLIDFKKFTSAVSVFIFSDLYMNRLKYSLLYFFGKTQIKHIAGAILNKF